MISVMPLFVTNKTALLASALLASGLFLGAAHAVAQTQVDNPDRIDHEALPYLVVGDKVDRSTYVGWRLFHSTCYICHGVDATGTTVAPDLTKSVKNISYEEFIVAVLYRYPIIVGFDEISSDDLASVREKFIKDVKKHERGELLMPTWDKDPNIRPHLEDLYAYLRARADGVLKPGRPEQMKSGP